jgi:hypothetical protein
MTTENSLQLVSKKFRISGWMMPVEGNKTFLIQASIYNGVIVVDFLIAGHIGWVGVSVSVFTLNSAQFRSVQFADCHLVGIARIGLTARLIFIYFINMVDQNDTDENRSSRTI